MRATPKSSLTREGKDAICTLWVRDIERFAFVI